MRMTYCYVFEPESIQKPRNSILGQKLPEHETVNHQPAIQRSAPDPQAQPRQHAAKTNTYLLPFEHFVNAHSCVHSQLFATS